MARLSEIDPVEQEVELRRRRTERQALMVSDKPAAEKLTFQSLGDAFLKSAGARGIERSAGGEQLIRDISVKQALERAKGLGLTNEDAKVRVAKASEHIKKSLMACESPIERRLLPALVFADYGAQFLTFPAELHIAKEDRDAPDGDLVVIPQFAFIRYRLDFAIVARAAETTAIFAVECDGEAFHA